MPGAQLHSRYNPQAEAVRYIDSLDIKNNIECFILIEPGVGYIIPALREKFKGSKIIALHVDESFPSTEVPTLNSTDEVSVQNFLEKEVPDTDAQNIRVIEWRPSMNYYKEAYVKLLSQTVEFIKRIDAGKKTVSAFGRRWVRNFFRNIGNIQKTLLYKEMENPVIITGSGPSLEKALPVIRNMREGSLILASSSSVAALVHYGIQADIVITTDGGIWALKHIYPYIRNFSGAGIAANLCAALPSQCGVIPHLLMNDGSYWQTIILHELNLPSVVIPQRGTVTASAVELAMALSSGKIYLAGMDLSVRDIRTHIKPYSFDYLLFNNACRISPAYSKSFFRSRMIQGGSLEIYAAWFKKQLASWPKRIFSITDNHEVFENAPFPEIPTLKNTDSYFKIIPVKDDPANFCKRGKAALINAIRDSAFADNIKKELMPMLFPTEKKVTDSEFEKAIEASCG